MTIPQGDNRGPQSISERRKVTFSGDSPGTGQQPSSTTHISIPGDHVTNKIISSKETANISISDRGSDDGFPLTKRESIAHQLRDTIEIPLSNSEHVEANVTVLPPADPKKTIQPLLNILHNDGTRLPCERSRKLSLNFPRTIFQNNLIAHSPEKTRRFSQPSQRLYYQKVPQEEPSPLSTVCEIFTLHELEYDREVATARQKVSTYSAEVHAPFQEKLDRQEIKISKQSLSLDIPATKRVFFGKERSLTRVNSSSCRSLDDIVLVDRGGGYRGAKSTNRSASSEDLSVGRKKVVNPGSSGGQGRQAGVDQQSSSSPSHCCLVSVSRVPMAAATSHLTLDSDYQTVRLAVLGAPGVGKSSIVRQFVMQQFNEDYVPTEQKQVFCPAVIINEHLYEVRIIDCPYIPYFPVNSLYEWTDFRGYGLRNATAYVLVYDITSEESFEYIKSLRLQILESRNRHDVPIFVVGNKHDLAEERGVPRREVREIANLVKKQWKCGYIECSAKYNWHIMLLFKELMKTVDYIDYGHKPTSMRVQDALRRNRCRIL